MPGLVPANGVIKQAFGNGAPQQGAAVADPDALTSATLTDNSAGTANTTVQALSDGTTWANDVAAARNNFADLAAQVNALRVDLSSVRTQLIALITSLEDADLIA